MFSKPSAKPKAAARPRRRETDAEFLSSWGFTDKLQNHFQFKPPVYSEQALDQIMREYERNDHALVRPITSLLDKTINFFAATVSDPQFKQVRDRDTDITTKLAVFEKIAEALETAKITLVEYQTKATTDGSEAIFAQAIDYCIACIKKRLAELKDNDDVLYKVYEEEPNPLKSLITPTNPPRP